MNSEITFYTPIVKFIDAFTHREIAPDENGIFPEQYANDKTIMDFYNLIDDVNDRFKRRGIDLEIIEVFLINENENLHWEFIRRNIKDNNRFGDIRKMICDISNIPCIVKPKRPNRTKFE